jgi:hypothetical protein
MSLVIFRIANDTLEAMSATRRRELELALLELNEDARDAGLTAQDEPIVIMRGPQGGLKLTHGVESLPLNRQIFAESVDAYGSAMDRLSRACATPFGPQNLQRFDEAKSRIHGRGAALMREALVDHHELNDLVARRLYTVVYLVTTSSSASRVMRHALDPGAN